MVLTSFFLLYFSLLLPAILITQLLCLRSTLKKKALWLGDMVTEALNSGYTFKLTAQAPEELPLPLSPHLIPSSSCPTLPPDTVPSTG